MSWQLAVARNCTQEGGFLPDLYAKVRNCDTMQVEPNSVSDFLRVLANLIQILLQVAGIAAVIFVIVGGIMYIASLGDPARTARAKETILYAVVGVIISLASYGIVSFITGSF